MTEVLIDANALLRYLLNDLPDQADQVERLLDEAERGELLLIAHSHIMAELVWVLSSYYKVPREEVREQLEGIIHTPGVQVEEQHLVLSALKDYVEKNVDYIDAYTVAWMKARDISDLASFDKHFKRYPALKLRLSA